MPKVEFVVGIWPNRPNCLTCRQRAIRARGGQTAGLSSNKYMFSHVFDFLREGIVEKTLRELHGAALAESPSVQSDDGPFQPTRTDFRDVASESTQRLLQRIVAESEVRAEPRWLLLPPTAAKSWP